MTVQADPIVKTDRDLSEIIDLEQQLRDQAIHDARATIDGTSLPGGRAMVALANAASPESWERRLELAEREWITADPDLWFGDQVPIRRDPGRPALGVDEDDSWEPPLQTLLYWSEQWRSELDSLHDQRPTIVSEAKFLKWNLNWARDHTDPQGWGRFVDDIRATRLRLENVVRAGTRADRTRVRCNRATCEKQPLLVKKYGPRHTVAYRCRSCGHAGIIRPDQDHCPNPHCWSVAPPEPIERSYPTEDYHRCPSCKARYDADDFRNALASQLRSESAEKSLPLADAIGTLKAQGRSERTIRKWLAPPLEHTADRCDECGLLWDPQEYPACPAEVENDRGYLEQCGAFLTPVWSGDSNAVVESYCHLATHQVWVWWPDLWRLHHSTRLQRRPRMAS